jgi:hypothetical protein
MHFTDNTTAEHIEEFRLYKMNKLAVAVCVFFVAVCIVEAQQPCLSQVGGMLHVEICDNQCCGKSMQCADSCKNYACITDDHCGGGKCKDGKCSTGSVKTVSTTIIGIVVLAAIVLSL